MPTLASTARAGILTVALQRLARGETPSEPVPPPQHPARASAGSGGPASRHGAALSPAALETGAASA